jgi:cytochrome oxidase Cu insertion factor (SCO1/SenC/PrrC family)
MGNEAAQTTTVLASALYRTLLWQFLVLVVVTAVITFFLSRRASRAADATGETVAPEPRGRRILRVGLGALWIIAGLLQAQPAMPSSFVPSMLAPALASAPNWLYSIANPFATLWLKHPVASDALTVWLQIGLGVGILVGGRRTFARVVLYASIGWAAFVWVVGELVGGLTAHGASWLTGAPGAALFYIVAAVLLLLPWTTWTSGVAQRWARRAVGAGFLLGAALQALPAAKFGSPTGLGSIFADSAISGMPTLIARPVQALADWLPPYASQSNIVLIAVLVIVGFALLLDAFIKPALVVAGVLTFFSWWFGQGFGVFGGVATDPNTGAIVLLLVCGAWPWPVRVQAAAAVAVADEGETNGSSVPEPKRHLVGTSLAVGLLVALPVVAAFGLLGDASSQPALGDSGGVVDSTRAQITDFALTDQNGQVLSTKSLRGKLVLISFLDPECYDSCPLLANQMANAVDLLGVKSGDVAIVAINVNPFFNHVQDTATFTKEHGLSSMKNWHFVTGSTQQVADVLASFGQGITVPRVGMIGHPQTVLLIDRTGRQIAALNDTANEDLTGSYEQLLSSAIRHYL